MADAKDGISGDPLTFTRGVSQSQVTFPSAAKQDRVVVADSTSATTGQSGPFNIAAAPPAST